MLVHDWMQDFDFALLLGAGIVYSPGRMNAYATQRFRAWIDEGCAIGGRPSCMAEVIEHKTSPKWLPCVEAMLGLFPFDGWTPASYVIADELETRWQRAIDATPGGDRSQVDARYVVQDLQDG